MKSAMFSKPGLVLSTIQRIQRRVHSKHFTKCSIVSHLIRNQVYEYSWILLGKNVKFLKKAFTLQKDGKIFKRLKNVKIFDFLPIFPKTGTNLFDSFSWGNGFASKHRQTLSSNKSVAWNKKMKMYESIRKRKNSL